MAHYTRARPEVMKERQVHGSTAFTNGRIGSNHWTNGTTTLHTPPRQCSPMLTHGEEGVMRTSPGGVRMAKHSRLLCYHQDTPIPLRHQERLSYNIPHDWDPERGTCARLHSGLSPSNSVSVPSPRLEFGPRGKSVQCRSLDSHDFTAHVCEYPRLEQANHRYNGLSSTRFGDNQDANNSCSQSDELGFVGSLQSDLTDVLGPDDGRFQMFHNRQPFLKCLRMDNEQKPRNRLVPNPEFNKDYKLDSPDLLPSFGSKPKSFADSMIRGKRCVNGLDSNVDEIKLDRGLQNEIQAEHVTYSSADCPVLEHQRIKATRMRAYDREYNNRKECNCEGVSSQTGKNPKHVCTEYHVTKKAARGHLSSTNGAGDWHLLGSGELFFDQNKDCSAGVLAVREKQGIVRELNSELGKRNPEQSKSNARSVVQLVFASNKPDKEKEADEFITLIDQSFAEFYSDKACVVEKTQNDRLINGANVDTGAKEKQSLNSKRDRSVCAQSAEDNYRRAHDRESYNIIAKTQNDSEEGQQSFSKKVDPHSNKSKALPERSSFEQIRRQLFNEAGLKEKRNDVIEEKTYCPGKLSFVRTIHQSVGEKEGVGDGIDGDFVYELNESVGRLAHNNKRNPKVDIILKTHRGKLAEKNNYESPFVRTIYQDCDQGSSSSGYVNTSGRPVSPFSDSVLSAVAFCSQDNTRHEYLRLRRRDKRLKYLSEGPVLSTLGLRTLGAMSSSGSSSSCGEKSNASCGNFVSGDLRSSELTERALRAHTLALKANSPSIRRRPTLDQFFGKVSEQGLQDSSSEQSDFSSSSDSVLMVQRTNKVNLTPASGLLDGKVRSPNKGSRALRLKAWKNRHENMFKSTRTATTVSERPITNGQRMENPGSPSREETSDNDNNILKNDIEADCVQTVPLCHEGLKGEYDDMAKGSPNEISEVYGENHNIITERASRFAAGHHDCTGNGSTGLQEAERFDCGVLDCGRNKMVNGTLLKSKSVESEDSFEEVYVEPELLTCSPPSTDRSSDSTDSSNHVNRREDSASSDVAAKKDSLDVFVGSASAILERVKRLKLKYNHKSTNIPSVNIEKDENGNVVGKTLGNNNTLEDSSGLGCPIQSPTFLKDSPKIKTIDKSDVFNRKPGFNTFDFVTSDLNEKKSTDVDFSLNRRSNSALEELRSDFSPVKDRETCCNSEEDIPGASKKVNGTVDEANTTQAKRHVDCLDNTGRVSLRGTKGEFKDICEPLFMEKKLANIDEILHGVASDETGVFVSEKKDEMTYEQGIVRGLSAFERDGRAPIYERDDSKDKGRSDGLHLTDRTESMQGDADRENCKLRNDPASQNGKIESRINEELLYDESHSAVNSVAPVKADRIQANGEKLSNEQENSTVNLNSNSGVTFASAVCNSSPIDGSGHAILCDQISSFNKQNEAPNQSITTAASSSILTENKACLNGAKDAESYRLNGLSGKFEEINSDNAREISPLSDRKDNIESGDFSLRRDGLSSLDNVIMGESKDSSIYLAGINDKKYEGATGNGISVQPGNEKQVRGQPCTYMKVSKSPLHTEEAERIVKHGTEKEFSRVESGECLPTNGLKLVDLESTLTADFRKVASEEPKKGVGGRSEINPTWGDVGSGDFQVRPGTLLLRKGAHGENLCDKDVNRLSNIDSVSFIHGEIDGALVGSDSIVDMASAKGVSDLKKRFENYQLKSELKADITKTNVTKQQLGLNDESLRNEHIEAKALVSTKGPSKLGALKSVFEAEKAEPLNPALARVISPKLQQAGFFVRNMQTGTSNGDSHDIVSSSGMIKDRKLLAEENTERESLAMESRGSQARDASKSNRTAQSGTLDKSQDGDSQKPAKIPPPVKRKPSLKKKGNVNVNGVSPKTLEKIDVADSKYSVHTRRGFALEKNEKCLTENSKNIDNKDRLAAAEENHRANKSGMIAPSDHSILSAYKAENGKAQSNDRKTSEVEKGEEHIVGLGSTAAISGDQELKERCGGGQTGLSLECKIENDEVKPREEGDLTISANAKCKVAVDRENERGTEEKGSVVRSYDAEIGQANANHHSVTWGNDAQAPCDDDLNAEETIASLLSQLEKACILSETDATIIEKGGKRNTDIIQVGFDNVADSERAMDTNEIDQKVISGEKGLDSNQEKLHGTVSETISRKNKGDTGWEAHRPEIFCDKLQGNYPVVTEYRGCKNDEKLKSVDEVRTEDLRLSTYKKEKVKEEYDSFGTQIHRKHSTKRKSDESNEIPCTHGITMATEMKDARSADKNCEIACHPICGLEGSQDLVTEESNGSKEGLLLAERENNVGDCGPNRGERFCSNTVSSLVAGIPEKGQDQKPDKKMLSLRSLSNSSDSSFDESDTVRPTPLDYDSVPSIGLPALLRESIRSTDAVKITEDAEEPTEQQPNHYISYSSIKSDVVPNGMYCKHTAKEHGQVDLTSTRQDKKLLISRLGSKKEVDGSEGKELEHDGFAGTDQGDYTAMENVQMCKDCTVTIANGPPKSNSPVVIQSMPMTLERINSLNIAKVSPYFHDGSSRKFMEPVTKFGGGIFNGSWQDNHNDTNVLSEEAKKREDPHIGYPLMRDSDTKDSESTMAELGKLEVVLNVPTESMSDDCPNLGVISIDGLSHWNDVKREAARNVLEHVKLVSDDCLGIGDTDIECLQIGNHKINRGEGKESPHCDKEDEKGTRCIVEFNGSWTGSTALLSYQLLIPKRTLEKYESLIMNHRCLIFCGQSGTGKSYLASKLGFYVAGRFSDIGNNNVIEPLHAVNVNVERWKEIKDTVMRKVSKSMPIVLVIDGFTPDFQEGLESLAMLLKQIDFSNLYVIAALNQATQEITVKWQNSIRWIWLDINEEPVQGLLTRYLRKKFLNNNPRSSSQELFKIADWMSSVWRLVNKTIESFHSAEQTIGPAMFFSCPSKQNEIEEWFADLWNYSLAPYILHTLRSGLKLFGQRCEWMDPVEWIVNTYPWKNEKNSHAKLKKIRRSDVGYWDVSKDEIDANSSTGNQLRLMNFLRRLETLVDNRTISTTAKPGTTQRRIYLESTL